MSTSTWDTQHYNKQACERAQRNCSSLWNLNYIHYNFHVSEPNQSQWCVTCGCNLASNFMQSAITMQVCYQTNTIYCGWWYPTIKQILIDELIDHETFFPTISTKYFVSWVRILLTSKLNWKEYIIQEGNAGTDVNGKFPVDQAQGELTGTDIRYKQTRLDG